MEVHSHIRYKKLRQIGVGQGMNSKVYVAEDLHLKRELAVKEIERSRIRPGGWDEYHREAQAMFACRHDHVVPIRYACLNASHVSLAMPYYSQGSLQDRIAAGPPPLGEAFRWADGILSALSQVHVAGLLHFDLKPSNVLFSDNDGPLIADFGQARLMNPSGVSPAPPMYRYGVPPEMYRTGVGSVESDLYLTGLTFYRMFNGNPYFELQRTRVRGSFQDEVAAGRFPNRKRFQPHIPPGLRRVIRRALKVDPANRYHSVAEFQNALGRVEIGIDWSAQELPDGEVLWTGERTGMAGLEVRQKRNGSGSTWDVEVFTRGAAGLRRKGSDNLWAAGLNKPDRERHLRQVFSGLESG